ncbi:MucR family transcriptional regulator [Arenibaculum pallidiluteum]|uniref:MucR family transcriptional regulator n=1 Tax=Arenibaculum pallidiluteum TaxID=2812559 RepID=UPI001A956B24|nr:MucR family transcriptional regulator [Arenibaculum pallidiluteum]
MTIDDTSETRHDLVAITAEITAAYLRGNPLPVEELPGVIGTVFDSLRSLGRTETVETVQEPAVPIKRSVQPDSIACLECGKRQKMLRRHLAAEHDLDPQTYRAKWNLPPNYPMTAPNYSESRSALAKSSGLGRRPRSGGQRGAAGGRRRAAK